MWLAEEETREKVAAELAEELLLPRLDSALGYQVSLAAAERVLPLFEAAFPNVTEPRFAIERAKALND